MSMRPHALFVTLEFADPLFSGNGTYSRSLVNGLASHGHDVSVVCAVPGEAMAAAGASEPMNFVPRCAMAAQESTAGGAPLAGSVIVYPVMVPAGKWKRLDREGPWREFAAGFAACLVDNTAWSCTIRATLENSILAAAAEELPLDIFSRVFVVDWTGHYALRAALAVLAPSTIGSAAHLIGWMASAVTFMNYRIFANPLLLTADESSHSWLRSGSHCLFSDSQTRDEAADESDFRFYSRNETIAAVCCGLTIALCRADAEMLDSNLRRAFGDSGDAGASLLTPLLEAAVARGAAVLLCPIRDDILSVARGDPRELTPSDSIRSLLRLACMADDTDRRVLVVCGVRLSRDKNAELFAELVAALASAPQRDADATTSSSWARRRLVPVLFGAAADPEYALAVKAKLRSACPAAVVIDEFVGPADLAFIFSRAVLNVHPSLYDAFGLSIVEAAVFGCPTLLHCPGARLGDALGAGAVDPYSPELRSPVGATDLLQLQHEVLGLDLGCGPAILATLVDRLLDEENTPRLQDVAARAKAKAERWTAYESVAKLLAMTTPRPH